MSRGVFRHRRSWPIFRRLALRWAPTVSAGVLHAKSGGITSALSAGASWSATYVKSGGTTSALTLGGERLTTHSKSGGIQSAGSLGGSDVVSVTRAGGITSGSTLGGSGAPVIARVGGMWSQLILGGERLTTALKPGGITSGLSQGATWLVEFQKPGGITSHSALGGTRTTSVVKASGLSSTLTLGGTGIQVTARVGGFSSATALGGTGSQAALRVGGIVSTGLLGGTGSFEAEVITKTGGLISGGGISVTYYFYSKTGLLVSPGSLGGDGDRFPMEGGGAGLAGVGRIVRTRPPKRRRTRSEILALGAERLLAKKKLPESYPEGAQKAYERFQEFYGTEDGRRIFIKKALEQGDGKTIREVVADVYATGTTVDTSAKKRITRVNMKSGDKPTVTILSRHGTRGG